MDIINWFTEYYIEVAALVGTAAALAATLPRPTSGKLLILFKVLDFLAMNLGKARNAEPRKEG
jgi:hypothetical protein